MQIACQTEVLLTHSAACAPIVFLTLPNGPLRSMPECGQREITTRDSLLLLSRKLQTPSLLAIDVLLDNRTGFRG